MRTTQEAIRLACVVCALLSALAMLLCGCAVAPMGEASNPTSSASLPASSDAPAANEDTTIAFSYDSGAYSGETLELALENPSGLPVVYTLDGSDPTSDSTRYDQALTLTPADTNRAFIDALAQQAFRDYSLATSDNLPTATVVRAAVLLPNGTTGPTYTNTYFVGEDLTGLFGDAMVISIVADPFDLLDYDTGIMALGAIYDQHREENERLSDESFRYLQANFTQRGKAWERPANLELFDASNGVSYETPCGIRLRGGHSRVFAQKSFNVYFRDSYGSQSMDYAMWNPMTPEAIDEVGLAGKSFALRSGGNSTGLMSFKDSFLRAQVADLDLGIQSSRPAILFLNGEFFGVYSLNAHYSDVSIASQYGVEASNVVMFEDGELGEGSEDDQALYDELMAFAERDLGDASAWDELCAIADVRSMAAYYAVQLYLGNVDFDEQKNCRLWRTRETEEGSSYGDARWRWLLYDLDFTAGMYGFEKAQANFDTMGVYLRTCPLFASALRNQTFCQMVRDALENLSTGAFEPNRVNAELDSWWSTWEPWMLMTNERFGSDMNGANYERDMAKRFFAERGAYVLRYFDEHTAALSS